MIDDKTLRRILAIKQRYSDKNAADKHRKWTVTDYMSGFVGDVGDLSKLVMAKQQLRDYDGDVDAALKHEIGDCFWALFVLCDELGIDAQNAIETTLEDLEGRLN